MVSYVRGLGWGGGVACVGERNTVRVSAAYNRQYQYFQTPELEVNSIELEVDKSGTYQSGQLISIRLNVVIS